MDKGTAGLNGTNGETTTQGKMKIFVRKNPTTCSRKNLPGLKYYHPLQVLMACRSDVPSTRKTAATLLSGGVC